MKESYIITLNRPDKATIRDMKVYISDALASYGGGFCPEEVLFGGVKCTVKRQYDRRRKNG